MLFQKDYSMNTFFANLNTFETNSKVFSRTENSFSLLEVGSGKVDLVFISCNSW